jgi:glycosyltransferase involved in cell wall biosynthesis
LDVHVWGSLFTGHSADGWGVTTHGRCSRRQITTTVPVGTGTLDFIDVTPLPISVVIPAYQRASLIERAVRSAWAQVPPPAEVIVVDDCSGDETGAVAAGAGATVLVHESNLGQGGSRNTGVAAAGNQWVAFLDSDDAWYAGHLATLWRHRGDHVLVGASGRGSHDGRVYGHPGPRPKVFRTPADAIVPYNRVAPSGAMVQRDALVAAGGFRKMRYAEDLDAWIRILERGTGVVVPDVTFEYRQHAGQVSVDLDGMSDGLDTVVASYAGRHWWSTRVQREAQAMPRWDQMMAARRDHRWGEVIRLGRAQLHPLRAVGLIRLLAVRRRLAARQDQTAAGHLAGRCEQASNADE